jgi:lipopolysaccharide assembly outer membrane protein LptD (OstA)
MSKRNTWAVPTFLLIAGVATAVAVPSARAQTAETPKLVPIEVTANDYTFSPETGQGHGEGNVRVRYQDIALDADVVDVNLKTRDVAAKGNVLLKRGDFEWRGAEVAGNVGTKRFTFGTFDVLTGVWRGKGSGGAHLSDGSAEIDNARLTTCDRQEPHYSIQASRVLYYPDGKFRAYNTVYRVGSVPIFYWPVLFGDTHAEMGSISIRPGYSSDWGAYLLLARTWQVSKEVETTVRVDVRSKNGVALGNDTSVHTTYTQTDLTLYGMNDLDTPETSEGYNRRFATQDWRGRAALYHRQELDQALTLRTNIDYLSDVDMLEDWYRHEYARDPQPRTFADVVYDAQRLSLSLDASPRLNDFSTVVEKLPELRLEMPRQVLVPAWPLLYQSSTTVGAYRTNWRDFDLVRTPGDDWWIDPEELADPEDYDCLRLDTTHFLYLPFSLADRITIVPRAGARLTHYSDSSATEMTPADLEALYDVDDPYNWRTTTPILKNYDDQGGSVTRLAGELGLEASTKFHRVWPDLTNETLRIAGLRHILQPYVNYTFAPDPSEDREHLYFFDAADRLTAQNFVRVGVDQRLQTRREQRIYTLASLQSYADFHFDDANRNDQDYNGFGDFGNKIEFTPQDALKTWVTLVTDLDKMDLRRAETGVRVGRKDGIRFSLAYVYRDSYYPRSTYAMGSSLADFTGEHGYLVREYRGAQSAVGEVWFPINERTSGRIRLEYDLEETELARQVYEIIRDLHCWMGSLAFSEDNGDYRIMLMLYLKAYPSLKIDVGS